MEAVPNVRAVFADDGIRQPREIRIKNSVLQINLGMPKMIKLVRLRPDRITEMQNCGEKNDRQEKNTECFNTHAILRLYGAGGFFLKLWLQSA